MEQTLKPVSSETCESPASLIRQFLITAGEIHRRDLSPEIFSIYESMLADIPSTELRDALTETLKNVPYWPTPPHVREQWELKQCKRDQTFAELAWDGVLEHVRIWGVEQYSVFMGEKEHKPPAFDDVTEFAMRQAGGYRTIGNAPGDQLRFMRKTFLDAYQRYRETGGYLAPTRIEAKQLLDQMPAKLTEKVLGRDL